MELHYIVLAIHLIVGFFLVFLAIKAFRKTRYPPMALLAVGFSIIVFGDAVLGDILAPFMSSDVADIIEETAEIGGFLVLIWAVKRS
jgi:uncharacterized membrane protein (UPF0182 family)